MIAYLFLRHRDDDIQSSVLQYIKIKKLAELLSKNIGSKFIKTLKDTNSTFKMICPFIGFNTASTLANISKENKLNSIVITKFNRADFYSGVSNIYGLKKLIEAGVKLKAIKKLHTKLYIFDTTKIILGSSNFTNGGLQTNIELNILIDHSKKIINQAIAYFNELDVTIGNEFEITVELILNEIKAIETLKENSKKLKTPKFEFGKEIEISKKQDVLENALAKPQKSKNKRTSAWLKFEGFSDDRRTKPNELIKIKLDSNNCYKTRFPKKPKGYKEGELVFIARNSLTEQGEKSPIIFGYGITRKFDEKNVVPIVEQEQNEDLKRWPYFVFIENLRHLKGKLGKGIPLLQVYRDLGNQTYPSTIDKETSFKKLKQVHGQKDKLRITEEAKNYLLDKLNELL